MSHALRTSRYHRSIPYYSSYTRIKKSSNSSSVLARKILIQALICIVIIFSVAYLQNSTDEIHKNILSVVRSLVLEKHISAEEIYLTVKDAYTECLEYIKGTN